MRWRHSVARFEPGIDVLTISNRFAMSLRLARSWRGPNRRLIWTIKDEETSLHSYRDPSEAQNSLEQFRRTYNFERPHQALGYRVPADLLENPAYGRFTERQVKPGIWLL